MGPTGRSRPDVPLGFAHRGARAECRDNTIASFDRALALGATALESDAWLTADGVVVLDHDGLVRRGARRVPIRDVPASALPAHVPTLAALLDRTPDTVHLSLDVKDPAAGAATVALVETAGRAGCTWLCGSGPVLAHWRSLSPEVRLVDSTRMARIGEGLAERVAQLAATGVDAVNLRWPEWDPSRLEIVHGAGLLAFAWDTQRRVTISTMAAMGVDAVFSDHVGRMVDVLGDFHRQHRSGRGSSHIS